jgi:hypothetical protein
MRKRYVLRNGKIVVKGETVRASRGYYNVLPDITPFTTPGDNTLITSRSQLRAYERKHGIRQVGNDFATLNAELHRKVYGDK